MEIIFGAMKPDPQVFFPTTFYLPYPMSNAPANILFDMPVSESEIVRYDDKAWGLYSVSGVVNRM